MNRVVRSFLFMVAVCLMLSISPVFAAASYVGFCDVSPGDWYTSALNYCVKEGIVAGYPDGSFRPDAPVTYAEFFRMIAESIYAEDLQDPVCQTEAERCFSRPGCSMPWYGGAAYCMVKNQILDGLDLDVVSRMDMASVVCRADAAQVLSNLIRHTGNIEEFSDESWMLRKAKTKDPYTDWSDVSEDRRYAVLDCDRLGVMNGQNGRFYPDRAITRAQAITMVWNLHQAGVQRPLLADGEDVTVANVEHVLEELRKEYPTGTSFADPDVIKTTNVYDYEGDSLSADVIFRYGINGRAACGGWAALVSDRIFGMTGNVPYPIDPADTRPGDIVFWKSGNRAVHVAVALTGIEGGRLRTCDGNYDGHIMWFLYDSLSVTHPVHIHPNRDASIDVWSRYPV